MTRGEFKTQYNNFFTDCPIQAQAECDKVNAVLVGAQAVTQFLPGINLYTLILESTANLLKEIGVF